MDVEILGSEDLQILGICARGMSAFSGAHRVGRGGEYEAEADIDMDCAANNFFLMISSSVLA